MSDEFSQLTDWDDADQRVVADDDEAVFALSEVMTLRPHRHAWREDLDGAPFSKPVYARQQGCMRVMMAMREEDGWLLITRDGECRPLDEVASWAPLAAAFGV
ncbi:MAG: hypothetical protein QM759_08510 [Terricaulis sp.]